MMMTPPLSLSSSARVLVPLLTGVTLVVVVDSKVVASSVVVEEVVGMEVVVVDMARRLLIGSAMI
jgi:hypothetical protein